MRYILVAAGAASLGLAACTTIDSNDQSPPQLSVYLENPDGTYSDGSGPVNRPIQTNKSFNVELAENGDLVRGDVAEPFRMRFTAVDEESAVEEIAAEIAVSFVCAWTFTDIQQEAVVVFENEYVSSPPASATSEMLQGVPVDVEFDLWDIWTQGCFPIRPDNYVAVRVLDLEGTYTVHSTNFAGRSAQLSGRFTLDPVSIVADH